MSALILALGVGAATAMFSVTDEALLQTLPWPGSDRIMYSNLQLEQLEMNGDNLIAREYDPRSLRQIFSSVAGFSLGNVNLAASDRPLRVQAAGVTSQFLDVFGLEPSIGRFFSPSEMHSAVVVLSHALWVRLRDRGKVGQMIDLNGRPFTIVGVAPDAFSFPNDVDLWVPFSTANDPRGYFFQQNSFFIETLVRLKPGISPAEANAFAATLASRMLPEHRDLSRFKPFLVPLHTKLLGDTKGPLLFLIGAVALLLSVANVHLTSLLLAWGVDRTGEFAARAALGASRSAIIAEVLTQLWSIAVAGSVAGALLATWAIDFVRGLAPASLTTLRAVTLDKRALMFCILASVVPVLISGLVVAFRMSHLGDDVLVHLRRRQATYTTGRWSGLKSALVVTEVAAVVVLLASTGLLLKSFDRLLYSPIGFGEQATTTFDVALPAAEYVDPSQIIDVYQNVKRELLSFPGVDTVAVADDTPLEPSTLAILPLQIRGRTRPTKGTLVRLVSPDYFRALGIPLLKGAIPDANDERAVLINSFLAKKYWPQGGAVGSEIKVPIFMPRPSQQALVAEDIRSRRSGGTNLRSNAENPGKDHDPDWLRIAGVVADVRELGPGSDPLPTVYASWQPRPSPFLVFAVKTNGSAPGIRRIAEQIVQKAAPGVPAYGFETVADALASSLHLPHLRLSLLLVFTAIAVGMGAIGVGGLASSGVALRMREMAIRAAMGATPEVIFRRFVFDIAKLVTIGCIVGFFASIPASAAVRHFVPNTVKQDWAASFIACTVILLISILAALWPASAIFRSEPFALLRHE